jgi:hypothetical protein
MHKIAGSRSFCTFLKKGKEQCVRVCTHMYLYILACTGLYVDVPVHTGIYWYVLVYTSMYQYIQVYTGMYRYVLVHPCLWKPYYEVANALVQGSTDIASNVML